MERRKNKGIKNNGNDKKRERRNQARKFETQRVDRGK